jgi:hypothetical protein
MERLQVKFSSPEMFEKLSVAAYREIRNKKDVNCQSADAH